MRMAYYVLFRTTATNQREIERERERKKQTFWLFKYIHEVYEREKAESLILNKSK